MSQNVKNTAEDQVSSCVMKCHQVSSSGSGDSGDSSGSGGSGDSGDSGCSGGSGEGLLNSLSLPTKASCTLPN